METLLTDMEQKIGSEAIITLLKRYESQFVCAGCGQVPVRSYITVNCEHNFCDSCVNKKPFFNQCPKCRRSIDESSLVNDGPYDVFSKFYHHYKDSMVRRSLSSSTPEVKTPRSYKKSDDFLLQEECRKCFKNRNGSIDTIRKLLSSGANPNVLNKDGWTLMHEAVDYENLEVLEVLLEAGGNVNAYSGDMCTSCLHDSLDEQNISPDVIKCLLNYGADINGRDPNGVTPLEKVAGNPVLLELLRNHKKIYDIPIRPIPPKVPLLYGCNLSPGSSKNLSAFCFAHKMKLAVPGKKISKDVTHIIVEEDNCEPHHEVLMGMLYGCYIVRYDWIDKSLKEGLVLPAKNYEITGTKNYPRSYAAKKSRLNAEALKPRLFSSAQFYIMDGIDQKLTPNVKEELVDLVTAGGGKILKRAKSFDELSKKGSVFFHADPQGPLRSCSVVVLYKVKPPIVYHMDTIQSFHISWLERAVQTFTVDQDGSATVRVT